MIRLEDPNYWNVYPDAQSSSFEQRLSYRLYGAGIKDPRYLVTDQDREGQYDRLLALTGNTPITLHDNPHATILVKRLSQNPTESHYDAGYVMLLRELESEGVIWPTKRNADHNGKSVELWELTSGSAGMGFGFACTMLGFERFLLVPAELPAVRIQHLRSLNPRIELTPPGYIEQTSNRLREKIKVLKATGYKSVIWDRIGHNALIYEKDDHRVCIVNHSAADIMVDAFKIAAQEVADYLPRGVSPDFFVNIIGNLTSSTAFLTILRNKYRRMKSIGLEDMSNPDWFDKRYPGKFREKYGYDPTFTPPDVFGSSQRGVPLYFGKPETLAMFSDIVIFDPKEASAYMDNYNRSERRSAIDWIGKSSAACIMVSEQIARDNPGAIIITVNYDKGDRYDDEVPAFTPSMMITDALRVNRFESSKIQPIGWTQARPLIPCDIPHTLEQAYSR